MSTVIQLALTTLLMILVACLVRLCFMKDLPSRLLIVQIMSTTSIGIILLQSWLLNTSHALDIALVFALLAAISAIAFSQKFWRVMDASKPDSIDREN